VHIDYGCSVWAPYKKGDITFLVWCPDRTTIINMHGVINVCRRVTVKFVYQYHTHGLLHYFSVTCMTRCIACSLSIVYPNVCTKLYRYSRIKYGSCWKCSSDLAWPLRHGTECHRRPPPFDEHKSKNNKNFPKLPVRIYLNVFVITLTEPGNVAVYNVLNYITTHAAVK